MKSESPLSLDRVFLVWAALLLLSTASGHLHSPDGEANFRTTQSLATGQGYAIEPLPGGMLTRRAEDGKEYSQYGPLAPVLAIPLYWVGRTLTPFFPEPWLAFQAERLTSTVTFYRSNPKTLGPEFPGIYPPQHSGRMERATVGLFNIAVTWVTVLLLLQGSRRWFGQGLPALILPLAYLTATYAWPHSRPFFTEPLAVMFLWASCLLAGHWPADPGATGKGTLIRSMSVGLLAGCAVLARLDSVVALPGVAWIAIASLRAAYPDRTAAWKAKHILVALVLFAAAVSVIPLQNLLRFGGPLASGYSDEPEGIAFDIPFIHSLWIYLVSAGKGILWYSPPLLASLVVWPAFVRKHRHLAIGAVLIFLGYLLVIGRWQNLGGWCWGPRHLFQVTLFLLLPLPLLFDESPETPPRTLRRPLFLATFLWGIAVQFMGVLVDFMWPLDRYLRAVDPAEHSARMLSGSFYGPFLHLRVWRTDRDPDWFLWDLWRSGEAGARLVSGCFWLLFLAITLLFLHRLRVQFQADAPKRKSPPDESPAEGQKAEKSV